MGYLEFEPWFLPRFPADFFPPRVFFPAGFFWPPSDSSSCVNCRSALSLVLDLVIACGITYCYSARSKPNGFSSCCVLRGGAEILCLITAKPCCELFQKKIHGVHINKNNTNIA